MGNCRGCESVGSSCRSASRAKDALLERQPGDADVEEAADGGADNEHESEPDVEHSQSLNKRVKRIDGEAIPASRTRRRRRRHGAGGRSRSGPRGRPIRAWRRGPQRIAGGPSNPLRASGPRPGRKSAKCEQRLGDSRAGGATAVVPRMGRQANANSRRATPSPERRSTVNHRRASHRRLCHRRRFQAGRRGQCRGPRRERGARRLHRDGQRVSRFPILHSKGQQRAVRHIGPTGPHGLDPTLVGEVDPGRQVGIVRILPRTMPLLSLPLPPARGTRTPQLRSAYQSSKTSKGESSKDSISKASTLPRIRSARGSP